MPVSHDSKKEGSLVAADKSGQEETEKSELEKKLEDLRPSGSEINNLYNYLKEKAFLKQQFSRDNKLIISLEEKIN